MYANYVGTISLGVCINKGITDDNIYSACYSID